MSNSALPLEQLRCPEGGDPRSGTACSPVLCNAQTSSNGARELTAGKLHCFVRGAFMFIQQLLHNHSLLVYPVKSCQVVWEGVCLQCGITVGAGHVGHLPLLACLIAKAHVVVGSSGQLSPNPTGSAYHGLCLQAIGFKANTLKKFYQDTQGRLGNHWVS